MNGGEAQRNRLLEAAFSAIPGGCPGEAHEQAIYHWRENNRRARCFGLVSPALPPFPSDICDKLRKAANDAYWTARLTKQEVADEVAAIAASAAHYKAMRGKRRSTDEIRSALRERDGEGCWLCREELGDDCTVEHKQPLSRDGTWAFANLALAHSSCNRLLGNAPAHIKQAAREQRKGCTP